MSQTEPTFEQLEAFHIARDKVQQLQKEIIELVGDTNSSTVLALPLEVRLPYMKSAEILVNMHNNYIAQHKLKTNMVDCTQALEEAAPLMRQFLKQAEEYMNSQLDKLIS